MKLNLLKKAKKGFTLVEILLVVGFIAIATIGIYVVYQKVNEGGQTNTEARNLDTIRAGVKNLWGVNRDYSTLTDAGVIAARIPPSSMTNNGTAATMQNSFGGAVTVAPVSRNGGSNNAFTITYNNVPAGVCTKLVPTSGAQFDEVTVGGTVVKAYGTNTLNAATTATSCGGLGANGGTIIFTSM